MKILKFLAWEEGGLIYENSNYATAFLIPKVQKGTQKISWKLWKYPSSWAGKKVDSSGKIPTMPPHSSYLKSRREPKKSRGNYENTQVLELGRRWTHLWKFQLCHRIPHTLSPEGNPKTLVEAMKIAKFLAWEEGGLIWENSNYATAFLTPKVQKGTQKIPWKLWK